MPSRITFGDGTSEYTVYAPQYGYSTKVVNPFHFQRVLPFGYKIFDDGATYDYRIFSGEMLFDESEAETFINLYSDIDKGRGLSLGMRLPQNSGFTPFGPDKGDYGNYSVIIYDLINNGPTVSPYKYFSISFNMIASSFPFVSVPATRTEGTFQIGNVTGLRFPVNFPRPSKQYNLSHQTTRNGTVKIIDRLPSDHDETSLKMICSRSRTYELITHLTTTVRANNLNIVAGNGTYLFNVDNSSGGTYTCQWIDEDVTIIHTEHNRYEYDLNFSLVSYV